MFLSSNEIGRSAQMNSPLYPSMVAWVAEVENFHKGEAGVHVDDTADCMAESNEALSC